MDLSNPAIRVLMTTPQGRRALALASPEFFDVYYCGMRSATHRTTWLRRFDRIYKETHGTIDKKYVLILAPRGHGKTEAAITLATRLICFNRDIRIKWIGEASGSAELRLARIKALLDSPRIQEDFCDPKTGGRPFKTKADQKWNERMIFVDRDKVSVDPTLEAIGSGGGITGGHPDIIFADDIEDERTTYSDGERRKTRDWLNGTVLPTLDPGGILFVIGTRKHHDDVYAHMIRNPIYEVFEDRAIIEWPKNYKYQIARGGDGREYLAGVEVEGEGVVLWPEERPLEYLLKERYGTTPRMFAREYQHQVQDADDAQIKWEWLERAKERGRNLSYYQVPPGASNLVTVQGWDLSLVTDKKEADRKNRDYTVGTTLAKSTDGMHYILGIFRERGISPGHLPGIVQREYDRVLRLGVVVREVAVERNAFGELHYLALQHETDLPLHPHITHGRLKADPWEGVPSIAAIFELDKVTLPYGDAESREMTDALCAELFGLGVEAHDDMVMSLWISLLRLRKGGFTHQVGFADHDLGLDTMGEDEEEEDQDEEESKSLDEVLREWDWR